MKLSRMTAGVAAAALLVGATVAGCGDDKKSNPPSSAPSSKPATSASSSSAAPTSSAPPAQPGDYTGLLMPASDIAVPGDTFTLTQKTPINTPAGIEGIYNNQNNTRKVEISIYIYGSPAEAAQALDVNSKAIPELAVKNTPVPADVGTGAMTAVGPSPDGLKAKGIVMFTEGKVLTVIELESAPDDLVDQDFVLDLGRKQDAVIKANPPA